MSIPTALKLYILSRAHCKEGRKNHHLQQDAAPCSFPSIIYDAIVDDVQVTYRSGISPWEGSGLLPASSAPVPNRIYGPIPLDSDLNIRSDSDLPKTWRTVQCAAVVLSGNRLPQGEPLDQIFVGDRSIRKIRYEPE